MEIENIKPLGNLVMIRLEMEDEKTVSGIIRSTNVEKKMDTGIIVKISEDLIGNPDFEVGTRVIFKKWTAEDLHSVKDCVILDANDIIATVC